jgi:hypothetical protein
MINLSKDESPALKVDPIDGSKWLSVKALEVNKNYRPALKYIENDAMYEAHYMSICCPKHKVQEAAKLLSEDFNRLVEQGVATSVLTPLSMMEMAITSLSDINRMCAVFLFFHGPASKSAEIQSEYIAEEGVIGRHLRF